MRREQVDEPAARARASGILVRTRDGRTAEEEEAWVLASDIVQEAGRLTEPLRARGRIGVTRERDRLLARWQEDGDREALGELLFSETRTIKSILVRRGGTRAEASDIVQEAGLHLLRKEEGGGLPAFEDAGALRGYLLKIAWNLCVNRYRQAGRRPMWIDRADTTSIGLDPATTGGLGQVESADFKHALHLALNILPELDQRIVELYDLKNRGFAAIAEELGLPTADAARMRRKRAHERLAPLLGKWLDILEE